MKTDTTNKAMVRVLEHWLMNDETYKINFKWSDLQLQRLKSATKYGTE